MNNDTIFALSSGHGKSGVAVIRISGTALHDMAAQFIGRTATPRHAHFTNLRDCAGDLIDQCLVIYFPAPQSFTGEDVIEIHSHGAPAVIEKIFAYLATLGARMATPGEFSRRAFYNNKMDLADVDGLAALLDARTEAQRKTALHSMMGGDSKIYDHWRNQIVEISAYAAAMMDYADDELPANIGNKIRTQTAALHAEITSALSRYAAARAVRSGFNITLAGEPNVGKSSLFNRLVGHARAIVSDIAGTTRDVVSEQLDIDGYLVNLSDTAGLRDSADTIEKIGIEKTKSEIENADLILHVYDCDTDATTINANEVIVINKADKHHTRQTPNAIYVSALNGDGIDTLLNVIKEKIHELTDGAESSLVINTRTRTLLIDAADELHHALTDAGENHDIFAEHTRRAADCIGKILGTITATEVMDATFGQLCLGK